VRVVLLGPPGAGKGTQAKRLAQRFGISHIATGDIFRKNLQEGTELGLLAKKYMEAGELVPDDVTTQMVVDTLARSPRGYVLYGFPRTIPQAEALDADLRHTGRPLDAVLAFVLDDETAVKRIAGRRTCADCQRPYNVELDPPRRPDACDVCGGPLIQRPDDAEETIRRRLEVYHDSTEPLIEFYRLRGQLREVDANGTEDQVTERAIAALDDATTNDSAENAAGVR
jgi:adenylate kinase